MIGWLAYLGTGVLLAAVLRRRRAQERAHTVQSWLDVALCVTLWPLWGPISWSAVGPKPERPTPPEVELAREVLRDAEAVVHGTPLEALLTRDVAARIVAEFEQLAVRRDELRRLARLDGPTPLLELAEGETRRLAELLEVVRALRTRLVLARYSGASLDGVGDLLGELTTRVESLDEVFEMPKRSSRLASAV